MISLQMKYEQMEVCDNTSGEYLVNSIRENGSSNTMKWRAGFSHQRFKLISVNQSYSIGSILTV